VLLKLQAQILFLTVLPPLGEVMVQGQAAGLAQVPAAPAVVATHTLQAGGQARQDKVHRVDPEDFKVVAAEEEVQRL
jgi:hypothetical protein